MLGTCPEYATHRGVTPQAIYNLINRGRLEIDENRMIDFEAADAALKKSQRVRVRAVNSSVPDADDDDDFSDLLGEVVPRETPRMNGSGSNDDDFDDFDDPERPNYMHERARRERAAAAMAEMKLAQSAGELIPAALVARRWQAIAGEVRTALMQMPARLAPLLAQRDQHDIRTMLDQEIRAALEGLSATA